MIWITKNQSPYQLWRRVKKLGDFKAENGSEYVVAKSKKEIESGYHVPVYIGVDGKLKKTNDFTMFF
tara:strand:- start:92 stop:292 length:201 start_codon:yes stop_codon:yes gene_type:complete